MIIFRSKKLLRNLVGEGNIFPKKVHERIVVPVVVTFFLCLVPSGAAMLIGKSLQNNSDLVVVCDSIMNLFGFSSYLWSYVHLLMNRRRFYLLFDDLEDIIHRRMQLQRRIYWKAKERIDFYSDLFRRTQIIPTIGVYFGPHVWMIYQWMIGEYSNDKWFYISKIWTPFGMDTAAKWVFVTFLENINAFFAMMIFYWIFTVSIEFMLYPGAFIEDIKLIFGQMDRLSRSRTSENSKVMVDHCKEIVDLMCRINRCMAQIADLWNFMALVIVGFLGMELVCCLFTLEKYMHHTALSNLLVPITGALLIFVLLFILFFSGHMLHSNLMELSDVIYQSEWYQYPPLVRQCIVLMLIRAQRPFYLSVYGVITFRLENYVEIVKKTYSAYMVLHSID